MSGGLRILLTGATGFLGRHLLAALHRRGHRASALVRQPAQWPYGASEAGEAGEAGEVGEVGEAGAAYEVARFIGDPAEPSWPGLAGQRFDVIVHAAAAVHHSRRHGDETVRVNVGSALAAVRAAQRAGARLLLLSSSGTVGCFRRPGRRADEHSPYSPAIEAWPYYRSKRLAEQQARRLALQLGVTLAIARPPVLLGPGDHRFRSTGHVSRVLLGRVPVVPPGGISFADVRDVATALVRLAEQPSPRAVYHLPGHDLSLRDFFALVAEVAGLGRQGAPSRQLPGWAFAALARARRSLPLGALPDPVLLEMARHHWAISSLWSEAELGYAARSARQTVMDTVAWLRAHHPELRAAA